MNRDISNWKHYPKGKKKNIKPGTVTCTAKARIGPKRSISKLLSSWIILRQLFKSEVEQILDTDLFCKVITSVVCNVIANGCNRQWSGGGEKSNKGKSLQLHRWTLCIYEWGRKGNFCCFWWACGHIMAKQSYQSAAGRMMLTMHQFSALHSI